jgi:hypothetical protein
MLHSSPAAAAPRPVAERDAVDPETFAREIVSGYQPVVLRGQVKHWPSVQAGLAGERELARYLIQFGGGRPLETLIGPPEIGGRFFYDDSVTGFNFRRQQVPLSSLLAELIRLSEARVDRPHAIYANAATAPEHLPGWAEANQLGLPQFGATPRLWIGNAAQVATHHDVSHNIAVVVAGRRRFTLFPPEQVDNLYVGPLDFTLAGPPTSMVDPDAPDLGRYPRFAEALRHAQVAELEPGDAIFLPTIWWHHVRALAPLNVLVNYWWNGEAPSPFAAMIHTMLAVRDLPRAEKNAWRAWFEHYVFDEAAAEAGAHLPEPARGVLGAPSAERAAKIRGYLLKILGGR